MVSGRTEQSSYNYCIITFCLSVITRPVDLVAEVIVVAIVCMLTQACCYLNYDSWSGSRGAVMIVTMVYMKLERYLMSDALAHCSGVVPLQTNWELPLNQLFFRCVRP